MRPPNYWKSLEKKGVDEMIYIGEVEDYFPESECGKRQGDIRHGEGYVYYWLGDWYISDTYMPADDGQLLLESRQKRKEVRLRHQIERLKGQPKSSKSQRDPIPDDVQIFVWKRDGGKCVKCGNQRKLEFDHIIPISQGGSNSKRNIQLLCEQCNREKGNKIGG